MQIGVRLPKIIKNSIYGLFLISLVTGYTFFILNQFIVIEGPFGPQKHPLQKYFLMTHGASAFLIMTLFGAMLAAHVPKTWHLGKNKITGVFLIAVIASQMITAYCVQRADLLGYHRLLSLWRETQPGPSVKRVIAHWLGVIAEIDKTSEAVIQTLAGDPDYAS